jgi:hypothetical protein
MARTPRTFSRGGDPEAEDGGNTGEGKPDGYVTGKARQTNQQVEISEILTDSEFEPVCGSVSVAPPVQRPFSRLLAE